MAFTILQNIVSKTAKENNINNFPGVDVNKDPCLTYDFIINNLSKLHYYCINPILQAFPENDIKLTSAYRCMELNNLLVYRTYHHEDHIPTSLLSCLLSLPDLWQ